MDVPVRNEFERILTEHITGAPPDRYYVLEVGATTADTLLSLPCLENADKYGLNLMEGGRGGPPDNQWSISRGNSHELPWLDCHFSVVLSSDTLEHDDKFWVSVLEMRRVLKWGGLMVIAVPGFAPLEDDGHDETKTYRFHAAPSDYYRFSEPAIREVFFEGFKNVEVTTIMFNGVPRFVAKGIKA